MSKLSQIPVRVEQMPTDDDVAIAQSILFEIHDKLQNLLAKGEGGIIDLRSLPALNQASLQLLEKWLSLGEVSAMVTGVGKTEVRETAYAGVWWLVFHNQRGDIVTESIQIAEVPDILKSQLGDIELGFKKLTRALSALEK